MDKYVKKVYDFVLSCPDRQFLYGLYDTPSCMGTRQQFIDACIYLEECGYAVNNAKIGGVHITHRGAHKREIEIRQFWHSFFTHYLPGFISGILATVIGGLILAYVRLKWGI